MKISILISSEKHPINSWLNQWVEKYCLIHDIQLVSSKEQLDEGDILFLISCSEIITRIDREKFDKTLVIHASDLPMGRGWSPHIWDIVSGAEQVTISLLEAEDKVDSGDIWKKVVVKISKTALYDEINRLVFEAELDLMSFAVENMYKVIPDKQSSDNITYWRKRTPEDSEININKTISEQFDLIRVCDPDRFPSFFYKDGKKFKLKVELIDE